MAGPVGLRLIHAKRVEDIEPVRPGLHESSGELRRQAHLWPVPRHALLGITADKGVDQ